MYTAHITDEISRNHIVVEGQFSVTDLEEILEILDRFTYLSPSRIETGLEVAAHLERGGPGRPSRTEMYADTIAEMYRDGEEWRGVWYEAEDTLSRSSLYRMRKYLEEQHGVLVKQTHGNTETWFPEVWIEDQGDTGE